MKLDIKAKGVKFDDLRLWAASTLEGKNDLKTLKDVIDYKWRHKES